MMPAAAEKAGAGLTLSGGPLPTTNQKARGFEPPAFNRQPLVGDSHIEPNRAWIWRAAHGFAPVKTDSAS